MAGKAVYIPAWGSGACLWLRLYQVRPGLEGQGDSRRSAAAASGYMAGTACQARHLNLNLPAIVRVYRGELTVSTRRPWEAGGGGMNEGRELLPFWPRRLGWILLTEVMQEQKVRGRANCALGKPQLRCLRTLGVVVLACNVWVPSQMLGCWRQLERVDGLPQERVLRPSWTESPVGEGCSEDHLLGFGAQEGSGQGGPQTERGPGPWRDPLWGGGGYGQLADL